MSSMARNDRPRANHPGFDDDQSPSLWRRVNLLVRRHLCRLRLALQPRLCRLRLRVEARLCRLRLRIVGGLRLVWIKHWWGVPPAAGPRSIACATEPRSINPPCKAAKRSYRVSSHAGDDRFAASGGDQSSPKSRPACPRRPLLIVRGGSEEQTKRDNPSQAGQAGRVAP